MIQSQEHKIHDCSDRRETAQLNFVVIDTTDHVGARERERATDHFFGKCELINRETVCSLLQPNEKEPTLFLVLQKIRQPGPQKPPQLGPSVQQSHCQKNRKQKEILRHKSHYCIAQSPKGEAEIKFLLPYLLQNSNKLHLEIWIALGGYRK